MSAHAQSPQEKVRLYFKVFFALFVITLLEVGATFLPGHKMIRDTIIVILACTKAGAVGYYYYMHLNHEKEWLRIIAVLPIFMLVYAAVLIPDTIHDRPTATYLPMRPRVFPVHEEHADEEHEGEHADVEAHEEAAPEHAVPTASNGQNAPPAAAPTSHSEAPAAASTPTPPPAAEPATGGAGEWR